jgi:hypothetical protein
MRFPYLITQSYSNGKGEKGDRPDKALFLTVSNHSLYQSSQERIPFFLAGLALHFLPDVFHPGCCFTVPGIQRPGGFVHGHGFFQFPGPVIALPQVKPGMITIPINSDDILKVFLLIK